MPAKPKKAKPRSAEVAKAKPCDRRRIARAVPARPGPLTGAAIVNAAYYIAGQAAVARGIGAVVYSAAINPRWMHEGEIAIGRGRCRLKEDRDLIYLAGPMAQRRFAPRSNWRTGNNDFDIVKKDRVFTDGSSFGKRYLVFLEVAAQRLVDHFWADIEAIAKALLKHGTLTGRQILAVISEARNRRRSSRRPHPLTRYRRLPWRQKCDVVAALTSYPSRFYRRYPWLAPNIAAQREAALISG
jgi:hypothetical protein